MGKPLSNNDISKLAYLARLYLSEAEKEKYAKELSTILEYVQLLSDIHTNNYKPTTQVTGLSNVYRDDEIIDYGYNTGDLMTNVPFKQDGFIKVKRMIE